MANPYSVTIRNVSTDGTNVFVDISVFDGLHTFPPMQATFPAVGITAAIITNYAQTIANNQPTLPATIAALVDTTYQGA